MLSLRFTSRLCRRNLGIRPSPQANSLSRLQANPASAVILKLSLGVLHIPVIEQL